MLNINFPYRFMFRSCNKQNLLDAYEDNVIEIMADQKYQFEIFKSFERHQTIISLQTIDSHYM